MDFYSENGVKTQNLSPENTHKTFDPIELPRQLVYNIILHERWDRDQVAIIDSCLNSDLGYDPKNRRKIDTALIPTYHDNLADKINLSLDLEFQDISWEGMTQIVELAETYLLLLKYKVYADQTQPSVISDNVCVINREYFEAIKKMAGFINHRLTQDSLRFATRIDSELRINNNFDRTIRTVNRALGIETNQTNDSKQSFNFETLVPEIVNDGGKSLLRIPSNH